MKFTIFVAIIWNIKLATCQFGMTKLLVASGMTTDSVEIINLDENNPDLKCDDLQDLPIGTGATGQLLMGKIPIICSGLKDECGCHSYQNGSWEIVSKPNECRQDASSTILSISDNHEVLFVFGGTGDDFSKLKSVETFDGNVWDNQRVTDLPEALSSPCTVKINSTMFLSIGGVGYQSPNSKRAYFYNALENKWTAGPSMKVRRAQSSCGLLTWKNPLTDKLEKVVVIAGGFDSLHTFLSSTELLLLNEDGTHGEEWINGPELPNENMGSRIIEYHQSVILVGGDLFEKKLYQLLSPKGPWIEMRQTLKTSRVGHVAFLVPDDCVNCHK